MLIPRDDTMAVTDLALDVLRGRTEPRVLDLLLWQRLYRPRHCTPAA